MSNKKHLLFTFLFLLLSSFSVQILAQDDDAADEYPYPEVRSEEYKEFVPEKRHDQQDKFMDRKYNFPAKPRHKWEIGLNAGLLMVSGDVKARPGFGVGGHIRRAFGYTFSLRGSIMMGETTGRNWQGTQGWARSSLGDGHVPNQALAGNSLYDPFNDQKTPNYVGRNGDLIYYNYLTKIREAVISGVVNIHNIRFHKRETKLNLYGFAGLGGLAYRTFTDQLDASGQEYTYESISNPYIQYEDKAAIVDALDRLWDGEYESQAERHFDDPKPFDDFSYKPTAHVGLGIAYKLNRSLNLALESKVTYTNDDLLDGQRWQEWGALTRDYDTYVYTNLGLNINLGAKNSVEPLWWMNPLDYAYAEAGDVPCCDELELPDLSDDDKDGVPNMWDEEPDSREGCPVDTKGRMLDSDRDGVLDCDDKCPHSPPYDVMGNKTEVDEFGCSKNKLSFDCESFKNLMGGEDKYCDCVKKSCRPIPPPPPANCCSRTLPSILFDSNRYGIKPEFEPQLAEIARIMKDYNCTRDRVAVIGHTDGRGGNGYNDVLSYKRAQEVINALVEKYGIPRSKLVLQYSGEMNPAIGGISDADLAIRKGIDADQALNRRVEIRFCPAGADMPRPAGPNAGRKVPKP